MRGDEWNRLRDGNCGVNSSRHEAILLGKSQVKPNFETSKDLLKIPYILKIPVQSTSLM